MVTFAPPEPEQIRPTLFDTGLLAHAAAAQALGAFRSAKPTGEFETARAVPGSYRLRVFDPVSLDVLLTEPIRTGTTDVVVRFPDRGQWPALHGVVVDRRGNAMPGADWMVEGDDPTPGAPARIESAALKAAAGGVIDHPPLSRDVHTLCVKAAGMADWVRVALADLPHVDGAGKRTPVVITQGNVGSSTAEIPLVLGRSQTFMALDDCVALVLLRGGQVVGRVPVSLRPGEMNVLRP